MVHKPNPHAAPGHSFCRVWIELEPCMLRDSAEQICAWMEERVRLANNMLRRLGVDRDVFTVLENDGVYEYAADEGGQAFSVLTDNGKWFNLDYLGRPPAPRKLRVRAKENQLNNVAFLYQTEKGWACMLANRTPAAFSYAGIKPELEAQLLFALEKAEDEKEVLRLINLHAYSNWTYELVG